MWPSEGGAGARRRSAVPTEVCDRRSEAHWVQRGAGSGDEGVEMGTRSTWRRPRAKGSDSGDRGGWGELMLLERREG